MKVTIIVEGRHQPTATQIATTIQTKVGDAPASSFKNGNLNLANAFNSKVQEAIDLVAAADAEPDRAAAKLLHQEALDKIQNDLMKKCDADPAGNWIVNTADARTIYDLLVKLRDAVLANMNV